MCNASRPTSPPSSSTSPASCFSIANVEPLSSRYAPNFSEGQQVVFVRRKLPPPCRTIWTRPQVLARCRFFFLPLSLPPKCPPHDGSCDYNVKIASSSSPWGGPARAPSLALLLHVGLRGSQASRQTARVAPAMPGEERGSWRREQGGSCDVGLQFGVGAASHMPLHPH